MIINLIKEKIKNIHSKSGVSIEYFDNYRQ